MACEEAGDEVGTAVSPGTVQDHASKRKTGWAPGGNGQQPALLPEETFAVLSFAFEAHIQCNQTSGVSENHHCSNSIAPIQRALDPVQKVGMKIVHWLLQKSDVQSKAEVALGNEEQRTRWTTCGDVKAQFSNWRINLEHLGFGMTLDDKSFHIPDNQLCQIIDLDELALLLDGNKGRCSSRPRVTLQDPRLPSCCERC